MAENNNISESPDNIAMMGELDGLGQQINALPENALRAETEEKLKRLRVSVSGSPNVQPENLRAGIDDLKKDISAIQKIKESEIQIQDVLKELSSEKIESAIRTTESLIGIFPEGKYKTLLRGYAGSMILEQFEKNNHNIILRDNNTVAVSLINASQDSSKLGQNKIDLEMKLNNLLTTNRLNISTLRIGMLYRAPSFVSYSNTSRDGMGNVQNEMKARNPQEYFKYLADQKANGYKTTSSEDILMASEKGFVGFDMLSSIQEVQDLGQMQKEVQKALSTPSGTIDSSSQMNSVSNNTAPQSGNQVPSVVGEGIGTIGGAIGKIAWAGAKGGMGVIADIFNGATKEGGAWGWLAVLGGLIASIWKFGLWKTLAWVFGIGVVSEAAAGRIDLGKEAGKAKKALEKWTAAVWGLASSMEGLVDEAAKPEGKKEEKSGENKDEKPTEKIQLTPNQEGAKRAVMADKNLLERIETSRKTPENAQWKIEDYLNFIHSPAFQNQKLSSLIFTEWLGESIFSAEWKNAMDIKLPPNLSAKILKRVLRAYLTGNNTLGNPEKWAKEGEKEKSLFTERFPMETNKDKTFQQLTNEVYK